MRRILFAAFLALFCFSPLAHADTLQVKVMEVQDGRTIVVENTGRRMKVILKGADAPELDQPMGDVARQHLADLILGKQVGVEFTGMDYGSHFFFARVFSGGADVSLQMIRDGVAWYDHQFEKELNETERTLYAESEKAARSERRGVWQDSQPVPPWEWRQAKSSRPVNQPAAAAAAAPVVIPAVAERKSTPRVVVKENGQWPVFSPSGAPFSVRMPAGKQFSVAIKLPDGEMVDVNIYWVNHLKIGYIAMWASGPRGDDTIQTLFEDMQDRLNKLAAKGGAPCEFKLQKDTSLNGFAGRRYNVSGCFMHGGIRLYLKPEGKTLKMCMIGVLGVDENDPSINEFLESFTIQERAGK
jgi:endonuclease YncB( thermonuclease family)